MENAVDALKIAFGILVFVIAITVSFTLFSQAKSTSDIVLYSSDKTNYYTYQDSNLEPEVGIDTVISELNRYAKGDLIKIEFFEEDGVTPLVDGIEDKFDYTEPNKQMKVKNFVESYLLSTTYNYKDQQFIERFKEGTYVNTIIYILK